MHLVMKNTIHLLLLVVGAILVVSPSASAREKHAVPDSMVVRTFEVNGVSFQMRYVDAGTFVMGATPEQRSDKVSSDRPAHCVSLSHYYIGVQEVTQALWLAVMGEWRSPEEWTDPQAPANWLNWHDAQLFVKRLDSITGLPFRLPTEAEWEYAARGAHYSRSFRFAGSDRSEEVGWGLMNAGHHVHPVMQKKANELGLYDMTGNVSEWCSDWFAPYYMATEPNPQGPAEGEEKVLRGGSWDNCEDNRHISYRLHRAPDYMFSDCGLRLAMTVDIPTKEAAKEPAMTMRVKVGKKVVLFRYVAAENPFYVAESEVTCQQWKEVMKDEDMEKNKLVLTGVKRSEQVEFAERVSKLSGQPMGIATEEDLAAAKAAGVLDEGSFVKEASRQYKKSLAEQVKRRNALKNAAKWGELIGVRVSVGDDPVLNELSQNPVEERPFRLVLYIR